MLFHILLSVICVAYSSFVAFAYYHSRRALTRLINRFRRSTDPLVDANLLWPHLSCVWLLSLFSIAVLIYYHSHYADALLYPLLTFSFFYVFLPPYPLNYVSRQINTQATRYGEDFRPYFRNTPLPELRKTTGSHTHPYAAADRNAGSSFIDRFCSAVKRPCYSWSKASKDKCSGQRLYFEAKDMSCTYSDDALPTEAIIKLVDVDYYIHMPELLQTFRPIIMYTFQPKTPSGVHKDYCWSTERINGEDVVTMSVNGGAKYVHPIWNYDQDTITVTRSLVGVREFLPYQLLTYSVEQKPTHDPNHSIILLMPNVIAKYSLVGHIAQNPLRRHKYVYSNGFFLQRCLTPDVVSIQQEGKMNGCVLPTEAFIACKMRYLNSLSAKYQISYADILVILRSQKAESPEVGATILLAYLQSGADDELPIVTIAASDRAHYEPVTPGYHLPGKPSGKSGAWPLVQGATLPAVSRASDEAMLSDRVLSVTSSINDGLATELYPYTEEFCQAVSADTGVLFGTLSPLETNEVRCRQDRPSQRSSAEQCIDMLGYAITQIRCFMKRESYAKVTGPRNISNVDPTTRITASQYSYPLADVLKKTHWYAFGRHPIKTADKCHMKYLEYNLTAHVSGLPGVLSLDLSRCDGSQTAAGEQCLLYFGEYFFGKQYAELYFEQRDLEADAPATTKYGVKYETGNTTVSGSPFTTLKNTISVAMAVYMFLRHHLKLSKERAYSNLFMHGGDDALMHMLSDNDIAALVVFMKTHFNFTLKIERTQGPGPVTFLGRVFPDLSSSCVWIADVKRQAMKLHLDFDNSEEEFKTTLLRRAESLAVTDSRTPLLGVWAGCIHRMFASGSNVFDTVYEMLEHHDDLDHYASDATKAWSYAAKTAIEYYEETGYGKTYPVPESNMEFEKAYAVSAASLGSTTVDLRAYEQYMKKVAEEEGWEGFKRLAPFTEGEAKVEIVAIHQGVVVEPSVPPKPTKVPLPAKRSGSARPRTNNRAGLLPVPAKKQGPKG